MKSIAYLVLRYLGYVAIAAGFMIGALIIRAFVTDLLSQGYSGPEPSMPLVLGFFAIVGIAAPLMIAGIVLANYSERVRKRLATDKVVAKS